jgi:hypothetical protein
MDPGTKLVSLRVLKVRQTQLGDTSIKFLVDLCPNLQSLDVSFTLLKRTDSLLSPSHVLPLRKLSLTSTSIIPHDLAQILPLYPQLQILLLGALGSSRGSQASIRNTSAMTMDEAGLRAVTNALANFAHLDHVNLVGNAKLGVTNKLDSALLDFVSRVGRKCRVSSRVSVDVHSVILLQRLNLASIPCLRSADLAGLLTDEINDGGSTLETLILNNTGVDDEAGIYISICKRLKMLAIAGTRFTSMSGFFAISLRLKLS